jgi:hypothetical protein
MGYESRGEGRAARIRRWRHRKAYRQHGREANGAGRLLTLAPRAAKQPERLQSTETESVELFDEGIERTVSLLT